MIINPGNYLHLIIREHLNFKAAERKRNRTACPHQNFMPNKMSQVSMTYTYSLNIKTKSRFTVLPRPILAYFLKPLLKGHFLQSERGVNLILIIILRF